MLEMILYCLILIGLITICYIFNTKINNGNIDKDINLMKNYYLKKSLMTKYEKYFYDILIELKDELEIEIMPQVNLASIVNKVGNSKFRNELFRNIDFGVFTKDYTELLLLIEINDKTHKQINRKIRDKKVDMIVKSAGIRLIKFYTDYPNKSDYIKDRVKKEISNLVN